MKKTKIAACLILILSFFLPWVTISGLSISGANLPKVSSFFLALSGNDSSLTLTFYINYFIPILALVYLFYTFLNRPARIWGVLSGFIPLGDLIYMLRKGGMALMHTLTFGFYLAFLSSLVLIICVVFIEKVDLS